MILISASVFKTYQTVDQLGDGILGLCSKVSLNILMLEWSNSRLNIISLIRC